MISRHFMCDGCGLGLEASHDTDVKRIIKLSEIDGCEPIRQECPNCGCLMYQDFKSHAPSTPKVVKWPLTLRHVEHDPKTFRGKGELREYCREHKIMSEAL